MKTENGQTIKFIKMHGIGNDYVYINLCTDGAPVIDNPPELARKVSDRHFGIGADGLILVAPPEKGVDADVRMRMFNADGSESQMCGNGVRCVCKLAFDHNITNANPMKVQTGRGVLSLAFTTDSAGKVEQVTVDMDKPILEPAKVPVITDKLKNTNQEQTFHIKTKKHGDFVATFVSMGNPHAVIYVDNLESIDTLKIGKALETHPAFPERMNIHFVQIHSEDELTVIHFERGSGPTLACGTGACAVCVAGVLTVKTNRKILAHLPGGDLNLEWSQKDNHVFMSGPAEQVFRGEWVMDNV